MNSKNRIYLYSLFVFLGSFFFDQFTKEHMQKTMIVYEDPENDLLYRGARSEVGSLGTPRSANQGQSTFYMNLAWQYSRNKGAAFSMLADLPDVIRVPFFFLITILASGLISYYLYITPLTQYIFRFSLFMLLAGALGNFVDRLRHGYVIDFIAVDWDILGWQHDFAIFNVADVCINIGMGFLILDAIVGHKKQETPSPKT